MRLLTIYCYIFAVVSFFFVGCRKKPQYPSAFFTVDSLTQYDADSAIVLLQELSPVVECAEEPVRRYYQLLTIKAQDKAMIHFTSDSSILEVLQYYKSGGDVRLLPEAYYYAGRVNRVIGDAPQALDFFHDALDAIEDYSFHIQMKDNEYRVLNLKGKIYAQMAYLFIRQHLYDEAIKILNQALLVDSINNDSLVLRYDYCDLADVLRLQKRYSEALAYYDKSQLISECLHDSADVYALACQKAVVYNLLGENEKALAEITQKPACITKKNAKSVYYNQARIYSSVGMYEEAKALYSLLTNSSDLSTQVNANLWLANRASNEGDHDASLHYLNTYLHLLDSLNARNNGEIMELSQSLYNYQLKEKEIQSLKVKAYQSKAYAWMFSTIAAILLFIVYYERSHKKRIRQKCELLKGIIESSKQEEELKNTMLQKTVETLKSQELFLRLKRRCEENKPIRQEEWQEVEMLLSTYFPEFLPKLHHIYTFNETEWKLTLLAKLGFHWHEIACLIGRSYDAVWASQKRLLKKVFPNGTEYENWSNFLSVF